MPVKRSKKSFAPDQYESVGDFKRHNEEVKQVWEAYNAGHPIRVPFGRFTIGPRIWLLNPDLNTRGITWETYANDPEVMFRVALQFKYYLQHNIPHDAEMGIPEKSWEIWLDFQNVVEESWFGCDVVYLEGQAPASLPRYNGKRKHDIFEYGIPGPFDGIFGRMREFYEYFQNRAREYEFHGRPVSILPPGGIYTDGPFTVANGIRSPEILEDLLLDEDYYHRLMDLVTTAIIRKVRAWRQYLGFKPDEPVGGVGDDAIQFLSLKTYCEKVLPYHKRLYNELFPGVPRGIHLCGNVQRLLPTVVRELNIVSIDTGYPINFTALREELGEGVEILGGVPVPDLLTRAPQEISGRAEAILKSGIMRGGKFILKEANNLAPCTPLENIKAMYDAVKRFGVYPVTV